MRRQRLSSSQRLALMASQEHRIINDAFQSVGYPPASELVYVDAILEKACGLYEDAERCSPARMADRMAGSFKAEQQTMARALCEQLFLTFEAAELLYPILNWKAIS